VIRFWRTLVWGYLACFIVRHLMFSIFAYRSWFAMRICLDLFYLVVVGALAIWMRQWRRDLSFEKPDAEVVSFALKRRFALWLSLGVIVPACWFVPIIGG